MHELSIMESALSQALEEAEKAGATRILEIRMRVGVLSGVVTDALQFAFEAASAGTAAEGAVLKIETVPARFFCGSCQEEYGTNDFLQGCPRCQRFGGDLRAGRELELTSIELDLCATNADADYPARNG
jgi:hydrogenase nickel incorporation protein HypA/HybF